VPDKPIPEQDPITSKSYAAHYVMATIILIITLFWALWDEAWGQRPWKAFQEQFKTRYSAFLNTARTKSQESEKDVAKDPEYADLSAAVKKASGDSAAAAKAAREKLDDANARLLAVQTVFTDRRAYVNALTYELETSESASSKASKQKEIDKYKAESATVEFPDGSKKNFTFEELEKTYNQIRDERTKLSLELGDVLKPVTDARAKLDEYITDHMVDLTPAQIDGLKKKISDWDPTIVQINVAEANIVDRCESCHMGSREPLKITPAAMTVKGEKKPDEYAQAFVSHPEPELLKIHDPDKFGCSPCHQGNGRATTSVEKAHGDYEHWLWPLFPKENAQAGCQTCHSADMVLVSGDVQFQTINSGKEIFPSAAATAAIAIGVTTGSRGFEFSRAADQADRDSEERQHQANRIPDETSRCRRVQRRGQQTEWPGDRSESRQQQARRTPAAVRLPVPQPDAGREEDRPQPERRPPQAEQELDSRLAQEAD
jgi:hypothetical protein